MFGCATPANYVSDEVVYGITSGAQARAMLHCINVTSCSVNGDQVVMEAVPVGTRESRDNGKGGSFVNTAGGKTFDPNRCYQIASPNGAGIFCVVASHSVPTRTNEH